MTPDLAQKASALIEHIQTRFHQGHRRAFRELLGMAAAVELRGIDSGLLDTLRTISNELERHMFKEEMRLFPMMEQGGNTLIPRLIQDLHQEHVGHEDAMNEFRTRLRLLVKAHREVGVLRALVKGVDDLADELGSHIRSEDDELFPLFFVPTPPGTQAACQSLPMTLARP